MSAPCRALNQTTTSWKRCASTSTSRTKPPAPSRASRPEAVQQPPNTPDLLLVGGDVLLHDGAWRVERADVRSEEHTSELQSHSDLVCRLLLEKKKVNICNNIVTNPDHDC